MRRHTKPEDLLNWTSSNMATDRHGRMIKIQKKGTSFTLVINSLPVFTGAPSVETAKRVARRWQEGGKSISKSVCPYLVRISEKYVPIRSRHRGTYFGTYMWVRIGMY